MAILMPKSHMTQAVQALNVGPVTNPVSYITISSFELPLPHISLHASSIPKHDPGLSCPVSCTFLLCTILPCLWIPQSIWFLHLLP